jgi:hypothetical protein
VPVSLRTISRLSALFSFILLLQTGYAAAESRPKLLYIKNLPKSQIEAKNVEVWIAGRDADNGALCIAWKFDVFSKIEGRIPYKLVFYDDRNQVLYQYEVRVDVERGENRVQGREWFYAGKGTAIP